MTDITQRIAEILEENDLAYSPVYAAEIIVEELGLKQERSLTSIAEVIDGKVVASVRDRDIVTKYRYSTSWERSE